MKVIFFGLLAMSISTVSFAKIDVPGFSCRASKKCNADEVKKTATWFDTDFNKQVTRDVCCVPDSGPSQRPDNFECNGGPCAADDHD